MRKVEPLDEVVLLTNKFMKLYDTRHVVREGDDSDSHGVRVDVETERQSARKVHDKIILGSHAARQVQDQYQVQHRRTACIWSQVLCTNEKSVT